MAARGWDMAREEGASQLAEAAELDLRDAARRGEKAREDRERWRGEAKEEAAATLARSQAEAEEARSEVAALRRTPQRWPTRMAAEHLSLNQRRAAELDNAVSLSANDAEVAVELHTSWAGR